MCGYVERELCEPDLEELRDRLFDSPDVHREVVVGAEDDCVLLLLHELASDGRHDLVAAFVRGARVVVGGAEGLHPDVPGDAGDVVGGGMAAAGAHRIVHLPCVLGVHEEQISTREVLHELHVAAVLVLVVREEHEHLSGRALFEAIADRVVRVVRITHLDDEALVDVVRATLERDLSLLRRQRVERLEVQLFPAALVVEDDHRRVGALHGVAVHLRRDLLEMDGEEWRHHEARVHFTRPDLAVPRPIDVHRGSGVEEGRHQQALGVVMVPVGLKQCELLSFLGHEVRAERHDSGAGVDDEPVSLGQTLGCDAHAGGVATIAHLFATRDRNGTAGSVGGNDHVRCLQTRCNACREQPHRPIDI